MSTHPFINLTAVTPLVAALDAGGRALDASADRLGPLLSAAGLEHEPARRVAEVGDELRAASQAVHRIVDQARALDQPGLPLLFTGGHHPAWRDPGRSLAAAHEAAAVLRRTFALALGDGEVDELVGLLARHEGDPVFAVELWRLVGSAPEGMGRALRVAGASGFLDDGGDVERLFRHLGDVLAVASRSVPALLGFDRVMAGLERVTRGDAAAAAQIPLLLLAQRPFTRSFLRPAWEQFVLQPNHHLQSHERAVPSAFVQVGDERRDVRSLVLRAVARNPRAAAAFLVARDEDGSRSLDRMLGPGVLDGDDGRSLAAVISAATQPPEVGPAGPWAILSDAEVVGSSAAVVDAFGSRAHLLGWRLPSDELALALGDVAVRQLPSFRLLPDGFTHLPPAEGARLVVDQRLGLRFLSLVFSRPPAEDLVMGAGRDVIATAAARLSEDDHEGHLQLGLLWGALTDASLAGHLVSALDRDRDREEQRAAWELAQVAISLVAGRIVGARVRGSSGGGVGGRIVEHAASDWSADVVTGAGSTVEDRLIPDEDLAEGVLDDAQALVEEREAQMLEVVCVDRASVACSGARNGFDSALTAAPEPPGYVAPPPAGVLIVHAVLDGATEGDPARALDGLEMARDAVAGGR